MTTVIWKSFGFTAVIYLAAIAGISPELFEAATVDGASKMQRIRHVTVPGIKNTMVVLLLIEIGNMMNVGFELVYLLYNPLTYETGDVIATYVYRKGIAASVGLPNLSFCGGGGPVQFRGQHHAAVVRQRHRPAMARLQPVLGGVR